MNKQRFVALYLLVTISITYGMELPDSWWEHLCEYSWYPDSTGLHWNMLEHLNQETKNEIFRQLFTPKFKEKLFSKTVPNNFHHDNCWEHTFNHAQRLGAKLENIEIPDDILWHVKDPHIAQYLIDNGAKTDLRDQSTKKTLLHKAVEDPKTKPALVAVHLDHIDDAAQDNQDNTPLHALCFDTQDDHPERLNKADLLINAPKGRSILTQNHEGNTPFELAWKNMLKYKRDNALVRAIFYRTLKDKMEARVREESYPQDIGDKDGHYIKRYTACRERIEQLEEEVQKETKGYNSAQGMINYWLGSTNANNKKDD